MAPYLAPPDLMPNSVSQPVAVPAHVRQGYEFEDPPTPPHRPSLGLRPSSAVLTNTEVPPPPEDDDEGEFGFSDYNNLVRFCVRWRVDAECACLHHGFGRTRKIIPLG